MYTFTLREWKQLEKPKEEYLYNCSEFDRLEDGWVDFSIGMSFQLINYTDSFDKIQFGNHENLVMCSIGEWTDRRRRPSGKNRDSILKTLQQNNIFNQRVDSIEYFKILPTYKFIISPEGNGIDCHRHYEALMAGCIPIVEDHEGIREKYKGCPVLYTNNYSEITEKYLLQKYEEMIDKEYDFSKLFLSTYPENIKTQIIENGNYWSSRLTNKFWYSSYK